MTDVDPWPTFDRFLAYEIDLGELASWVRAQPGLADLLGPRAFRALVDAGDVAEARALVAQLYDRHRPGRLAHDRARRLARGMLDGAVNVVAGSRALAAMHREGHAWIPEAFAGIAAACDAAPPGQGAAGWDALAARLQEARELERRMRAPALVAARRLLERLETDAAGG